jgi:NADH-quinone oxidoreductase subunit G
MPIADLGSLDRALVIGSFLRKDHPLAAERLRHAARKGGAEISLLHSVADDSRIHVKHSLVAVPSLLPQALAEVVVAAAKGAGKPVPPALAGIESVAAAEVIAASLLSGKKTAILLGNYAEQHPDASQLFALAQALADIVGAKLGCLGEAANSVGGYAADASPQTEDGLNANSMFAEPRKAYLLLNVEPEFDCANPVAARAALDSADFVVVLSPFRHGLEYADAILPVGPFTETAGTFVNCEGRPQPFNGVVKPFAESRPAWKVLRVLGSTLGLQGFNFESIDDVRTLLPTAADVQANLANDTRVEIAKPAARAAGLERVADVPIHFADPLVRRSPPLQLTADAKPPVARMSAQTLSQIGIEPGAKIRVKQGGGEAVLATALDAAVPAGVVRIAAAHPSTSGLGGLSGPITVERA